MKRILALVITLVIFITLSVPCTAVEETAELEQLDKKQSICADTNGDGTINIHDATLIQKYVAKIIVEL